MLALHTQGAWFDKVDLYDNPTCLISAQLNSPGKTWNWT